MGEIIQHVVATALTAVILGGVGWYAWTSLSKRDIAIAGTFLAVVGGILILLENLNRVDSNQSGYFLGFMIFPAWLVLLSGIGLIGVAVFLADQRDMGEEEPEEDTIEEMRAENDFATYLRTKLEDFRKDLEDPVERGKKDALAKGGPFPKTDDLEPAGGGYEAHLRRKYETAGRHHLQDFLRALKAGLRNSMKALEALRKSVKENHYHENALSIYQSNLHQVRPEHLRAAAQEHKEAEGQVQIFRDKCGLDHGEPVDYANRRSLLKTILVFLLLFLPVEIGLSYWMLSDNLGKDALRVAAFAALFIVVFAGLIGYAWQWTKSNKKVVFRVLTSACVAFLTICYLLTLGFAMAYRGDDINAQGFFKTALEGYGSLFESLGLMAIFLINILAFLIAVHEAVHTFNRYHGWDAVNQRQIEAEDHWEDLVGQVHESTNSAIESTEEMCRRHLSEKSKHENSIRVKHAALKGINKDSIQAYGLVFSGQFDKDIHTYQDENANYRSQIYVPPAYFGKTEPIVFDDIAQEICEKELEDIPSEEEVSQVLGHALPLQEEADLWSNRKGQLRKAFNENDKEMIDSAIQEREYQPNPDLDPGNTNSKTL